MADTVPIRRRSVPTAPRGVRLGVGVQALALVAAMVLTIGGLVGITALVARPSEARPTPTAVSYLVAAAGPAPQLRLTGADGRPFDLASLRGTGALVFFGYTHCPDVCPATIGIVGQVLDQVGPGVRAVFVSVDPERDTVEWLADYLRYLPDGFSAATGTPVEVREAADAWGVRYARVDGDDPSRYSMNHTATVYLVDQAGLLRAEFPFGIEAPAMAEVVRDVLATPLPGGETASPPSAAPVPATSSPTASPTPSAVLPSPAPSTRDRTLRAEVVSSSVWTRGASPVILALYDAAGRINDPAARVEVRLAGPDGGALGPSVIATPVRPPGVAEVSYVATLDIPTPGWWKLSIAVLDGGASRTATVSVAALEPGGTAPLGAPAPTVRTPTLDDAGGILKAVTTDPALDRRLSETSTADALAAGKPFVLVVDSWRFRTSPACGQALVLARFLLDRWPEVPIIHLEPYEYEVISDTPVLRGTLSDPDLVPAAEAWGIGPAPWGPSSMPWIFVVDGSGTVRAKYQAVIGSADIDVILALIAAE